MGIDFISVGMFGMVLYLQGEPFEADKHILLKEVSIQSMAVLEFVDQAWWGS